MKKLIYSAIIVRLITQFICAHFDYIVLNDGYTLGGFIYAIGIAYFEVVSLWVFTRIINKSDLLINFVLGLAVFDLIKFIFLNPKIFTFFEFLNVIAGAIFVIFIYFYEKKKSKPKDLYKGKL